MLDVWAVLPACGALVTTLEFGPAANADAGVDTMDARAGIADSVGCTFAHVSPEEPIIISATNVRQ